MYVGETAQERIAARRASRTDRAPNLRDTIEQRRFEREAARIERQQAVDLRRIQRQTPLLPVPAVSSEGSPVVSTPSAEPVASGTDAGASAGGGSSTVNVTPGAEGGMSALLPLAIGAAALLLL